MSANVVPFNVAAQLHNRFNLIDVVRRCVTFCNALTGHFTRMHHAFKLLNQRHNQIAHFPFMNTMKVHTEAEFVISTIPSSLSCINEYLAIYGDCNRLTHE